ncbi:MAG: response regulator transcription factor [Bacteroidetes bacterium]|nr:response regulator transcription factor [Bacteroidota bacterium]
MNILIADDHTIVRKGLIELIKEAPEFKVIAEASNSAELINKLHDHNYDVIILDISMPGRSGLETLKEIKVLKPTLPVLILSMHPEEQYAVRAIKAGAAGYLNKDSAPEELINALKTISKGRKFISPTLAEQLANYFEQNTELKDHQKLSDREFEVMLKIANGDSLTDIANELSLSVKTISTYKSRILNKLHLKNSSELTIYVVSNKLNTRL